MLVDSGLPPDSKINMLSNVLKFKQQLKAKLSKQPVDKIQHLRAKLNSLNTLIKKRVEHKKSFQSYEATFTGQIIDQMADAYKKIEDNTEEIHLIKNRRLKTFTVCQSISNHSHKSTDDYKNLKLQNIAAAKQYFIDLSEAQQKQEQQFQKIAKLEINKDKFRQSFRGYNQGLLTTKDVKLYDYIHHKPHKPVQLNFKLYTEEPEITNKYTKPMSMRLSTRQIIIPKEPESHSSSLQSVYEMHLDDLYSQTQTLRQDLTRKKQSLPRKVKSIIKLDELGKMSLHANRRKLQM